MRIVLVSEAASGGVALHLRELIRGLKRASSIEIFLILPLRGRYDNDTLSPEVLSLTQGVFFTPMKREVGIHDICDVYRLLRLLHKIRPDIVHSHSSKAGALARICKGNWKQIYTPHAIYTLCPDLNRSAQIFYRTLERFLGSLLCDAIIAVSDEEKEHIENQIRPGNTPIYKIFNGISTDLDFLPREKARIELGIALNDRVIGCVARLQPQKGIDRLIAAAEVLEKNLDLRDIRIIIIGPGNIYDLIPEKDTLPKNVVLKGEIKKASRLFCAFDAFILPSRYEGFPYVFLEAAAAGIPIISTPVAGTKSFFREGSRRGYIMSNPDNPEDLAQVIIEILENLPSSQRVQFPDLEMFSAERMCHKTLEVYEKTMACSK